MTELEFKGLVSQGYNRIAFLEEALADWDIPLSLYLKLAAVENEGRNLFLLEFVVSGERFGCYLLIGLSAHSMLRAAGAGEQVKWKCLMMGWLWRYAIGIPWIL